MKFEDIEIAFECVSSGAPMEAQCFIKPSTGEMFFESAMTGESDLPEDLDEHPEDYVSIPHKYDLDLGQRLVWEFVDREIPGLRDRVRSIFSRRGAYSRYKDFLIELDLLEKWYEFSNTRTEQALRAWCLENGVEVDGQK